jgi:hypothetical protein
LRSLFWLAFLFHFIISLLPFSSAQHIAIDKTGQSHDFTFHRIQLSRMIDENWLLHSAAAAAAELHRVSLFSISCPFGLLIFRVVNSRNRRMGKSTELAFSLCQLSTLGRCTVDNNSNSNSAKSLVTFSSKKNYRFDDSFILFRQRLSTTRRQIAQIELELEMITTTNENVRLFFYFFQLKSEDVSDAFGACLTFTI